MIVSAVSRARITARLRYWSLPEPEACKRVWTQGMVPETIDHLPEPHGTPDRPGVRQWQIQLTVAMGNGVEHPRCLLQPYELLELMPLLARLYAQGVDRGLLMIVGNNIGFFGPYEHLWRGFGDESIHWSGCGAGHTVLGIESDGTIKACPSLPASEYSGGNVRRNLSVSRIWKEGSGLKFRRIPSPDTLWGFCRTCYYADVCGAGCTWTADSLLDGQATILIVITVLWKWTSRGSENGLSRSAMRIQLRLPPESLS